MNLHRIIPHARDRVFRLLHPAAPWLTPEAIRLLEGHLHGEMTGFEWGSGNSTVFFAERVRALESVEHDPAWHATVCRKLEAAGLARRVNYRLVQPLDESQLHTIDWSSWPGSSRLGLPPKAHFFPYFTAIQHHPDHSFDFVLVDGRARLACIVSALAKLKPGGLLVLDNSEWTKYRRIFPMLSHFRRVDTSNGLWQTTIWFVE